MKNVMIWGMLVALVWGCGGAVEPTAPTTTVNTDISAERADTITPWRARTTGLTLWVDNVLVPQEGAWVLRGRTSKSLSGFRAYDETGRGFEASLTSARKFEVRLTEAEALEVVAGERVYLDLFATRGDIPLYHGMVRFAPRLADWSGTSSLYVFRAVNPVVVGADVKFRGRATASAGFVLDTVRSEGATAPVVFEDEPRKYHVDFSGRELLHAAQDEFPLTFVGADTASTPVEKSAFLDFRIVQLGVGTEPPFEAWPKERCDEEMRVCLLNLPTADTEPCGWANEVRACENASMPLVADRYRFVADLKDRLAAAYDEDEARAHDGRTLDAALAEIRADRANVMTSADLDSFGFNANHFDGFSHVDPVYRASPRIWYGIYDHAGTLVLLDAVN